jgi:hypothetical protein
MSAIEKDNTNLKDWAEQLLEFVASVEGKVSKLSEEEEGVLALPTSKRKHVNK